MNVKLEVLKEIQQIAKNNQKAAEDNLERALKNDEFKNLYLEMKQLNFVIAKKDFLNENAQTEKQKLKVVYSKAEELLKKLNLSFKDFEPKYSCKLCNDTGFINDKYCSCFYEKLNSYIVNNVGVNVDKSHNFSNANFELFDDKDSIKNIYVKIRTWCETSSKYKNLLLMGNTGVGKTYLAECIFNDLTSQNKNVNYFTSFALNNLFLKFHTTFDETKSSLLDGVLNCNYLIIDDLGSEPKYKNVTEEYLYLILNERLVKNRSTVFTTNLTPVEIREKYGYRVYSRLCNKEKTVTVLIENKDLRLKKK